MYSLVPFLLIALANLLLVLSLYARRRRLQPSNNSTQQQQSTAGTTATVSDTKKQRNERMNQTVLVMTFLFIAMTSPIACASFFFDTLFTTDYGNFIIVLLDCVSFSYHGLNFVIMTLSNTMFRKEFFKILLWQKNNN